MGQQVKVIVKKALDLQKGINYLKNTKLMVGIPDDRSAREEQKGDTPTNAELLFIHTYGSPANNIPPRPVIEPAVKAHRNDIDKYLKKSINSALSGNISKADSDLKRAGIAAQNACRDWFTDPRNNWAPNSPSVKRRKLAKGSTDPIPLIDTGEMRKSITYVIQRKGGARDNT